MDAAPGPSEPQPPTQAPTELVIITGLSGSGKGTVLRVFEDLGYYAVDNLPLELIPKFVELCQQSAEIRRACLVVDVREGRALSRFPEIFAEIKQETKAFLLFLEASDSVLQRRFSETRRPHPLAGEGSLLEKIQREREQLSAVQAMADRVIDTSTYNIHDLRRLIVDRFGGANTPVMLVTIESFGFKHGLPTSSDLVFDVRFLPNPHYLPGGKDLTGQDAKVIEYVSSFPQTGEFIRRTSELLIYLLPHYVAEGKSYLTVSIGCTGGRHRSVMIAEEIQRRLDEAGFTTKLLHRDLHRG
ncbi:MAG: RNase adapter RapZ [Acidobacteria bacterium]|nr:RNase adapter RapZ [Acidobacteriota bacterium]